MRFFEYLNLFGVDAKQIPCIKGAGAPTTATVGEVGCFYMNTLAGEVYKCISVANGVYTWKDVTETSSYANALKGTASGEVVRINDASPVTHNIDVKVSGVDTPSSVKVARASKNLFMLASTLTDGFAKNGVVVSVDKKNHTVTFNGTATANTVFYLTEKTDFLARPKGTYQVSVVNPIPSGCELVLSAYRLGSLNTTWIKTLCFLRGGASATSFTHDESVFEMGTSFTIPEGTTLNNYILKLQIELNDAPTEYDAPNWNTYTPNADGTVSGLASLSPFMMILTDSATAVIEAGYTRDTQIALEEIGRNVVQETIVQETGTDENKVMSQKAVTNAIEQAKAEIMGGETVVTTVSGEAVYADGVSSIEHSVAVKAICPEGVDPTSVKIVSTNNNLYKRSSLLTIGSSQSTNGITLTVNEDGSITFNGTATTTTTFTLAMLADKVRCKAGTYQFSVGANVPSKCNITAGAYTDTYGWLCNLAILNSTTPAISSVCTRDFILEVLFQVSTGATFTDYTIYPQLTMGDTLSSYQAPVREVYSVGENGIVNVPSISPEMLIFADVSGVTLEVTYNKTKTDPATPEGECTHSFPYDEYDIPTLYFTGDTTSMTKENSVDLTYKYKERTGTCTMKWQGSSSLAYPKKNYTVKFDNAFEAVEGWGEQKKYCLKADWIDPSHLRNVCSAKVWGSIVKSSSWASEKIKALPNGGAIDGFPCFVVINDEWKGIYNFNIPKDGWMLGMGDGDREAILCAEGYTQANGFRAEAVIGPDFELEYSSDGWAESDIQASLNRMINAVIEGNPETLEQYLDVESAIDYLIFCAIVRGEDIVLKNYLLCTYDGVKWFFTAYDLDTTWGGSPYGDHIYSYRSGAKSTGAQNFHALKWETKLNALIFTNYLETLKARYAELRKDSAPLGDSALLETFYNYAISIPLPASIAEMEVWRGMPATAVSNIAQIANWIPHRLAYLDNNIAQF